MTKEEYTRMRAAIEQSCKSNLRSLDELYALSTSVCEVGDIIEDGNVRILVQRVEVKEARCSASNLPECYYIGIEVEKSGNTPKINGMKRLVLRSNVRRVIRKKEK